MFLVCSSGLFHWCYSLRLGCGLITQRASPRLSVLSGEPRGFPKNLRLQSGKHPLGSRPLGAVAAPHRPPALRRRTDGPRYFSRLCERRAHPGFAHGRELPPAPVSAAPQAFAWGLRGPALAHCPARGPSSTGLLILRGGRSPTVLAHSLSPPAPRSAQVQFLNFSSLERGVPHPPPRCAPPSRGLLSPRRPRGCGGGCPSPHGTSWGSGAEA